MSWTLKKNLMREQIDKSIHKKSEEISDIVDRMPMAFGRWVAIAVLIFSFLLLLFGWIIKYPDTVTGRIRLSSSNTPVKLVANVSGNILLESFNMQDEIKKGEYIAVINNPAATNDVRKVAMIVNCLNPNEAINDSIQRMFPEKVSLGDLNIKYYSFLSALKNQCEYIQNNIYERQRTSLLDDIKWKQNILAESELLFQIMSQKLEISQKWLEKYLSLNKEGIVTYEYEVDRSQNENLTLKQEEHILKKEVMSIKMQISENLNKIDLLNIEQREKERILHIDLLSTYQDLSDNIKLWEQRFVFKAPFDGKLEYLKFWGENQFVQEGEEVFGIVPTETNNLGHVLLPSAGAGKVALGSKVTVKLDNYPYMEYGSIEGTVKSISFLSQPQKTEHNEIETYLVLVDLPEKLTTNYGKTLNFQYEIGGVADIIVKERRLIERLFDNLKYITK